jgi:hypothetical protein
MEQSWRYWQAMTDPSPGWTSRIYDENLWPSGAALLYVENAALPAPKNTQLALGPMSYLFRTHFQFNGNPDGASIQFSAIVDDGAVFYLNGAPFYWLGMIDGVIPSRGTPADRTTSDAIPEGPFTVTVTNLLPGDNVLAVEVHQINATSSDIVFGLEAAIIEVRREMYTPGKANSVRSTLDPFPSLFLSEVLAVNTAGIADSSGEREPWVELANFSESPVQLDGYALSTDFGNLRQWTFPAGASLPATSYKVIWADAEPTETAGSEWHTSFRLTAPAGVVVLSRMQNGAPAVVDYLEYAGVSANQSFGFMGEDRFGASPAILPQPTPGTRNDSVPAPPPNLLPVLFGKAGEPILSWSAVAGRTYRLEYKDDLAHPAWQAVGQTLATSATASLVDASAVGIIQRFYRIVLLP